MSRKKIPEFATFWKTAKTQLKKNEPFSKFVAQQLAYGVPKSVERQYSKDVHSNAQDENESGQESDTISVTTKFSNRISTSQDDSNLEVKDAEDLHLDTQGEKDDDRDRGSDQAFAASKMKNVQEDEVKKETGERKKIASELVESEPDDIIYLSDSSSDNDIFHANRIKPKKSPGRQKGQSWTPMCPKELKILAEEIIKQLKIDRRLSAKGTLLYTRILEEIEDGVFSKTRTHQSLLNMYKRHIQPAYRKYGKSKQECLMLKKGKFVSNQLTPPVKKSCSLVINLPEQHEERMGSAVAVSPKPTARLVNVPVKFEEAMKTLIEQVIRRSGHGGDEGQICKTTLQVFSELNKYGNLLKLGCAS